MSGPTDNSISSTHSTSVTPASSTAGSPPATASVVTAGNAAAAPDFGETVTRFLALAEQVSGSIGEMFAIIPDLREAHPATDDQVRGHTTVPIPFLYSMVSLVEEKPELQALGKLGGASGRARLQFLEAFRPVYDKLLVFAEKLKFTLDERRASLSIESLQMYAIIKGLARDPSSAELVAYLAILKRVLNRQGTPVEGQLQALQKRNQKRLERKKVEAEKFLETFKGEKVQAEQQAAEKEAA